MNDREREFRSWAPAVQGLFWDRSRELFEAGRGLGPAMHEAFQQARVQHSLRNWDSDRTECKRCGAEVIFRRYEHRAPRPYDRSGRPHGCPE